MRLLQKDDQHANGDGANSDAPKNPCVEKVEGSGIKATPKSSNFKYVTRSEHKSKALMIKTLTNQTLMPQGMLEDIVIDTREDATKYMQKLKFRGKTTYLYYKDPKIQVLDEKVSMKMVKDLGMTMEEYMEQEGEQLRLLKKKKDDNEEVPQKKKDEEVVAKKKKKVTFSSEMKKQSTQTVMQSRTRSQTVAEAKKTSMSKAKKT